MYLYLKLQSCTKYENDPYYIHKEAKITCVLEYTGDIDDYKVNEILYFSDKDRYHMHIVKERKVIDKQEFDKLIVNKIQDTSIKIDSHYYIIEYA